MKTLKILSLGFLFALLLGAYNFANISQTHAAADSATASAEFVTDEITAESLGVTEADTTFWGKFKLNTRSIFTFDRVKQANIDLKKANIELLTVKKLGSKDNDSQNQKRIEKALDKYKKQMTKAEKQIGSATTSNKEAILQRLDEHQLKQQQLLRTLSEKLPAQVKEKIETVRTERMEAWYENHKENLEARLKEAVERNQDGSDFKHLQNLATLEEMKEALPSEAQAKIETALGETRDLLKIKLKNINAEEQAHLKEYLQDINLDGVKKIQLLDHLDGSDMPVNQAEVLRWKNEQMERVENNFKNLDENAKERFLQQNFQGSADGEVTKIEILEKLKNTAPEKYKEMIRALNEKQQEGLKTKIQNTSNEAQLERMEEKTGSLPVIRKEIQDRKNELPSTSNHQ